MLYYIGNSDSFEKIIKYKFVICLFTARWCRSCQMVKPSFIEIANNNLDVNFGIVDIDDFKSISEEYKIHRLPTFIIFKEGKVLTRFLESNGIQLKQIVKSTIDLFNK